MTQRANLSAGLCLLAAAAACEPATRGAEDADVVKAALADSLNPAVWIPGGTFLSGSADWDAYYPIGSPYSKEDERPHRWTVDGFWLQEHEVTNQEYARFDPGHSFPSGEERRPVANVTWAEAMAYARSLGGTLPSEVDWEFAARGRERREYPWGSAEPTCFHAHYRDCAPHSTVDVESRPDDVTPSGVYDLAGNVREWVRPDWFDPNRHPVNHEARRLKGGSFAHPAFFLRSASVTNDFAANDKWPFVGFRVAWSAGAAGP